MSANRKGGDGCPQIDGLQFANRLQVDGCPQFAQFGHSLDTVWTQFGHSLHSLHSLFSEMLRPVKTRSEQSLAWLFVSCCLAVPIASRRCL
jgi:hypothetical protein